MKLTDIEAVEEFTNFAEHLKSWETLSTKRKWFYLERSRAYLEALEQIVKEEE
jgi:hypothetical protein